MQINIQTLETARLTLVAPRWSHLDDYLRLYADPRVMQHIGPPLDEQGAFRVLAIHAGQWVLHGFGGWPIVEKDSGSVVGIGGLQRRPETGGQVEIGWIFSPVIWRKGYATEAARAILEFAFGQVKLKRVLARVAQENTASVALAQRLGMQLVPETRDAPQRHYIAFAPTAR